MIARGLPLAGLLFALGAGTAVADEPFGAGETAATSSQPLRTLVEPSRTVDADERAETGSGPGEVPERESAHEPEDYLTPAPPQGWNRPEAEDTDGDRRRYEAGEMGVGRQSGEPAGNALADPAGRTSVPVGDE